MCQVLWNSLRQEFFFAFSSAQWAHISQDFWRIWNDFLPHSLSSKHVSLFFSCIYSVGVLKHKQSAVTHFSATRAHLAGESMQSPTELDRWYNLQRAYMQSQYISASAALTLAILFKKVQQVYRNIILNHCITCLTPPADLIWPLVAWWISCLNILFMTQQILVIWSDAVKRANSDCLIFCLDEIVSLLLN